MKLDEKGYTIVELLIAITIMVMASGAAGAAIFQIIRNIGRNNDYITAVRQVENAGYWISRDTQMAQSISTNITLPNFLSLSWTEWNDAGNPIYHSANYTLEGLSDGIGKLERHHGSNTGANEYTLIAQYIYYNPGDVANTSNISYQNPVLTVKLTALFGQTMESKEYQVKRRPNF